MSINDKSIRENYFKYQYYSTFFVKFEVHETLEGLNTLTMDEVHR